MEIGRIVGEDTVAKLEAPKRVQGIITKVHPNGWGFIISTEIPFTRIYFHWSALLQSTLNFKKLEKKMKVEFTPRDYGEQGIRATKIKVLIDPPKTDSVNEVKDDPVVESVHEVEEIKDSDQSGE